MKPFTVIDISNKIQKSIITYYYKIPKLNSHKNYKIWDATRTISNLCFFLEETLDLNAPHNVIEEIGENL